MLVPIHTPDRDKKQGSIRSMDACVEHSLDPARAIVDHNNKETPAEAPERGYLWPEQAHA